MRSDWLDDGDATVAGDGYLVAERPEADPVGDGHGEADDLLTTGDVGRGARGGSRLRGLRQRLDLVAVMITVIIAGVVGYVGINIMSNTAQNAGLGDYNSDVANNTQWQNTTLQLQGGLDSFFSQIGTVFVVIVLVVVISYLTLLRGR